MIVLESFKQTATSWELRRIRWSLRADSAERRFYAQIIPSGPGSILDVGANHGSKTEIFRKLADRVIAVEPDPSSAGLLRRRFKWRRSVVVCQCAVTDTPGSKAFYQFEPGSAFNTADSTWAKSMMDGSNHMGIKLGEPKEIRVPARTIADSK